MLLTLIRSLLVLVLLGAVAQANAAGRRVALVIGNAAYASVPAPARAGVQFLVPRVSRELDTGFRRYDE